MEEITQQQVNDRIDREHRLASRLDELTTRVIRLERRDDAVYQRNVSREQLAAASAVQAEREAILEIIDEQRRATEPYAPDLTTLAIFDDLDRAIRGRVKKVERQRDEAIARAARAETVAHQDGVMAEREACANVIVGMMGELYSDRERAVLQTAVERIRARKDKTSK